MGVCLGVGLLFRLLELVRGRSLRWDESSLALNLVHLTPRQLLGPLENDQVAPPLFLLGEKGMVALLGTQELALRLLPWLCALAALFLFAHFSRQVLGSGVGRLFAVGLFAITDSLIFYSADAKQYSGDVAASLVIWICALRFSRRPSPGSASAFALSAALAPWFSHAALFVALGTGLALLVQAWCRADKRALGLVLVAGMLALASHATLYLAVLRFQRGNLVLDEYWNGMFAPLPPRSLADLKWYVANFFGLFTTPFGIGAKLYGLMAFTLLVGLAARARKDGASVLLLLLPLAPLLVASGLRSYPFQGRLLLFLVPMLWLGVGAGVERFVDLLQGRAVWIAGLLALLLAGHPLLNALNLLAAPRYVHEYRPAAEYLAQHRQPGEMLYLSEGSRNALRYYGERLGFPLEPVHLGAELYIGEPGFYDSLKELVGLRRVWFLFLFVDPAQAEADLAGRVAFQRLSELGTELDRFEAYGVRLVLYDLSAAAPAR